MKIPEGMLEAARTALGHGSGLVDDIQLFIIARAFCEHLSQHPIVPTADVLHEIRRKWDTEIMKPGPSPCFEHFVCEEFQRRMFLAEPEIPEEVKDLLMPTRSEKGFVSEQLFDERVIEAFRRGQRSKG